MLTNNSFFWVSCLPNPRAFSKPVLKGQMSYKDGDINKFTKQNAANHRTRHLRVEAGIPCSKWHRQQLGPADNHVHSPRKIHNRQDMKVAFSPLNTKTKKYDLSFLDARQDVGLALVGTVSTDTNVH